MKKWQEFLLFFVLLLLLAAPCEVAKLYFENSINFVFVALAIFVIGWAIVLFQKKLSHKKRTAKKGFATQFTYCMLIWSVCITFDVTQYFLENNILNKYYFLIIGLVFMFLGWISGRLDNDVAKMNKKRK